MQKEMKRAKIAAWGLLCSLLLCAFSTLTVSAQSLSSNQLLDLQAFGIVEGNENGDLELEKMITRAEFCKVLARMTQVDQVAANGITTNRFPDVPADHWAVGYIEMMSAMGIVGGYPDGNFYPDVPVEYAEAVCMLVRLLGYGQAAAQMGDYPLGYIAQAGTLGLVKNVSAQNETPLTRETAFILIYNALDIERLIYTGLDEHGSYQMEKGDTYREILMGYGENELIRLSGIITSTYDTWLIKPNTQIEPYQVELDGVMLDIGTTNAVEYLGQRVELFVQEDENSGRYVIRSIVPNRNNTVLEADFDDIVSLSESRIEYMDQNGSKIRENISAEPTILYNGLFVRSWSDIDLSSMQDGSVRLISNDGTGVFNVVFFNEYESFVVDSVRTDSSRINFTGDQRFMGQRGVLLEDDDNEYLKATLLDADGHTMNLEDVKKDDVVSIFASSDGNQIRIYVESKAFHGTVEEVDSEEGTLVIDGELFELEKKAYTDSKDISSIMGKEIKAYLNFEGKIAYWKEGDGANNYGAVVELSSGAFEKASAKLVVGDVLLDTEEESDDDYTAAVPAITAQNSDVRVYDFASKVRFDGQSYSGSEAVNKLREKMGATILGYPVIYKLNTDGEIREIQTPDKVGTYDIGSRHEKVYNSHEKTFGKTSGGAFGIENSTVAICVPDPTKAPISTDEDYLAPVDLNNGQSYIVEGFEFDEDTKSVKLIVITTELDHTTTGHVTSSNDVGLVYSSSYIAGEDGEQIQVIHMATEDGEQKIEVSTSTTSTSDFRALKPGQLILCSLDNADRLDGYSLVESVDPIPDHRYSQGTDLELFVGKIKDADYNEVSEELNRRVDIITMETNYGVTKNYEVQVTSTPPVYIYDTAEKKAHLGTHEDFLSSHSAAMVYVSYNKVKAVVIVK